MHSCLSVGRRVAVVSLVCAVLSLVAVVRVEARIGRAAERCQRRITQAGNAFVTRQLREVGRCTGAVLRCIEIAPDDPTCLPAASERCARVLGRLSLRELRLARTIANRCQRVGLAELAGADGLGFADLIAICAVPPEDPEPSAALGGCIARRVRCAGERLLAIAAPRTRELIRIADVPGAAAGLECLADHGGSGEGDPDVGEAITQCARSTARANARVVARTLGGYAACTHAILPCLGTRAGDPACLDRAKTACDGVFARISAADSAVRRSLAAVCAEERVEFTALAAEEGANLDAVADQCAALQVDELDALPPYALCLTRHQACETATLLATLTPRATELFALVGRAVDTSECPAAEPEPTATPGDEPTPTAVEPSVTPTSSPTPSITPSPTPTATPTVTGPTRTPRPGESATRTPTPSATRTPTPTVTSTPLATRAATRTPTRTPTPMLTATRTATPVPTRTVRPTATRTPTPVCGNGVVEGDEECDGLDLDDNDCDFLCEDEPDPEGTLSCLPSCRYDFRGCKGVNCSTF